MPLKAVVFNGKLVVRSISTVSLKVIYHSDTDASNTYVLFITLGCQTFNEGVKHLSDKYSPDANSCNSTVKLCLTQTRCVTTLQ